MGVPNTRWGIHRDSSGRQMVRISVGSHANRIYCMVGLKASLALPEEIVPVLAVALGYPAQYSEIYPMENGNYKYHLTGDGTLHVPKRSLEEILL